MEQGKEQINLKKREDIGLSMKTNTNYAQYIWFTDIKKYCAQAIFITNK